MGFFIRNVNAIAGVADVLESRGFKAEKAKKYSLTPRNCWSVMVNLETGYEPEYPIELTPVEVKRAYLLGCLRMT